MIPGLILSIGITVMCWLRWRPARCPHCHTVYGDRHTLDHHIHTHQDR